MEIAESLKARRPERIPERVPMIIFALSFVAQLAVVPIAVLWISEHLSEYLKLWAQPYQELDGPVRWARTVLPDVLGFGGGLLLRRLPGVVREPARWIWVVPTILFVGLLVAWIFYNPDPFWVKIFGTRGRDYAGAQIVGLVFPLGAVFVYSMGMRSGDRHTNPLADAEEE